MFGNWKNIAIKYWVTTIVIFGAMLAIHFLKPATTIPADPDSRMVGETIAVLAMLAGIPFCLKYYHEKTTTKLPEIDNPYDAKRYITRQFQLRYGITLLLTILNYISYDFLGSETSIYCIAICAIIHLFFCRPNKEDLDSIYNEILEKSQHIVGS